MMKRQSVILLAFFMLILGMSFGSRNCEAAAAPPLTRADVFMIGSENTRMTLVPSAYPHNINKSFYGENIFLRLKYTGYPNWNSIFVKINGKSVKWQNISRVPINNPATGYFHNIAVSFAEFDNNKSNRMEVTVNGSGGHSCTAQVGGIRIN